MADMMDRPYRNKKVVKERQIKAAEYKKKVAALRTLQADAKNMFVPPVVSLLVEESRAGIQPSDSEDSDTGSTPQE